MTQNEFNVVLEQQYRKCADVLVHKKKEYTGDRIDRLSAFKIAASLQGCTPKTALAGMMSKHVVSLYDMCFSYDYVWKKIKTFETEKSSHTKRTRYCTWLSEILLMSALPYEADGRKPRDEILAKMVKILYVPIDVLTVPVLSEPREYDAASFWMHELSAEL